MNVCGGLWQVSGAGAITETVEIEPRDGVGESERDVGNGRQWIHRYLWPWIEVVRDVRREG